jgi:hypothetical protein
MASSQPRTDVLSTFHAAVERDSWEKSRLAADVTSREEVAFTRIIATTVSEAWGASKDAVRDAARAVREYLRSPEGKAALRHTRDGVKFAVDLLAIVTGVGKVFNH